MEPVSTNKHLEQRPSLPVWKQQLLKLTEHLPRPEMTGMPAREVLVKAEQIDAVVWNRHPDLKSTLEDYGINTSSLEIVEIKPELFRLTVKEHFHDRRLPKGYVYKGGAARALLANALELQPMVQPRDIDVARLSGTPTAQDQTIVEQFMSDDAALTDHEVVEEVKDNYFASRDVTINEVYADDSFIFASKQCILDTVRRIIRPTPSELGWDDDDERLGPKMLAKVLRFWVETIHRYGEAQLTISEGQFSEAFIKPFWILVQLDKALEGNHLVAVAYTEKLKSYGQIPTTIRTPEQAALYLANLVDGPAFMFRFAGRQQFAMEKAWLDAIDDDDRPNFENNRARRREKDVEAY